MLCDPAHCPVYHTMRLRQAGADGEASGRGMCDSGSPGCGGGTGKAGGGASPGSGRDIVRAHGTDAYCHESEDYNGFIGKQAGFPSPDSAQ